jgi:glycosyltransferase involved in cell wall biosynthesis
MPAVTVVIPNYNHTRYLGEAIRSVLAQTYRDFEIVVVDDGSTDNCRDVVAEFGRQVRYVWQENQGLAAARNTGLRCARGELVGLLDADDEWLPAFLEQMVTLTKLHPEASAYYCGAKAMDVVGRTLPQVFGTPARAPETLYQELLRANFIIPSTVVMRRSAVLAAGLFDPTLRSCEDWDLWLRLLPAHSIVGISDCLVCYRVHANTLSTRAESMQAAALVVIQKNFGSDDENEDAWPAIKRRAYGGLYRYHTLISVQRNHDPSTAARHLTRALRVDPSLADDMELFYNLALGSQPQGYRGTAYELQLRQNAESLKALLESTCGPRTGIHRLIARRARGTASFAVGLVAYNTGELFVSLRYLLRALCFQPSLVRNRRAVSTLLKCLLGRSLLRRLRRTKARLTRAAAWNICY